MKLKFLLSILSLSLASGLASAAGDPPAPKPDAPKDAVLERYTLASEKQDWKAAAAVLEEGLQKSPNNADYHNLLAYSIRKGPNPDMSAVFKHYNEALRIDPKHKNAHEYLGEAYLMVGNVAKAKEHLAQLDKLCFFGCSQYSDLKQAIAAYEQKPQAAR
jgi:cytochrome c-type biogenesis protein CcmH/NrfG